MLVKAWLLHALARVASENDWEAATRALSGSDPLIHFLTARRMIRERRRAEQITGSDHPAHLARAASFRVIGRDFAANFDDEAALRSEYEAVG